MPVSVDLYLGAKTAKNAGSKQKKTIFEKPKLNLLRLTKKNNF
jgi:hypothetical protein